MPKSYFNKPSLSIEEQARKLKGRGLLAQDGEIESLLHRMSYYRFAGYVWWFYSDKWEVVRAGTTLKDVLELYAFDATLRTHILRLSHSIEVWLRASLTNQIAQRHGPMGYLNPGLYASERAFRTDLGKLKELLGPNSPGRFVTAFHENYRDEFPPIWMATELMTLGQISKWYSNLREDSLQKAIAQESGLNHKVLTSFLRLFMVLRNGSAHHSRVWNRKTALRGRRIRTVPELLTEALKEADESSINYVLAIAVFIVQRVDPTSESVNSLRNHLLTAKNEWLEEMDLPIGFEEDPLWNPPRKK